MPRRRTLLSCAAFLLTAGAVFGAERIHSFASANVVHPSVPPLDPMDTLFDLTPVRVTTTAMWQKVPRMVPAYTIPFDASLWRGMHFDDWDRLTPARREPAMRAMIARYSDVFSGPKRWAAMSTHDWDVVPQPVRAIAYLRMIWYWAEAEQVGVEFGFEPRHLAPTIAAIVMAESWFEHRAVNENQWGNRDLGLAQCSDHCRAELTRMAAEGTVDFLLEDAQYFNPWFATRVATVWFERELALSGGDVDLAIRAYHRGQEQALDEKGDTYLANVLQKRDRYIVRQRSASWRLLVERIRPL